ncbi:hypothetical protein ACIBEA_40285 [Streptomyces sp. NPDC051555]|uniref:hypothetical protein n=1 Tax=Streptomyces sp. NPDC051555 TaxID=3365657 RepID=UPI0037BBC4BD
MTPALPPGPASTADVEQSHDPARPTPIDMEDTRMSAYAPGPTEQLAKALAQLADEYPTDSESAEPVTLSLDTDHALPARQQTGRPHWLEQLAVQLQPGQVQWLAQLVERELATVRNAHSDGSGKCAHCESTGSARPAGPVTHIVAWFPGDLLCDDPTMNGWEVMSVDAWERGSSNGEWVVGNKDPKATAEELLPLVSATKRFALRGPIRLTPSTWVLEGVGRNEPGYRYTPGPWTFPMFEVTPHRTDSPEGPAEEASRA